MTEAKRPKGRGDNPYLHARQEYAERYGSYIVAAKNWRLVALGSLAGVLVMGAANWHLANKAQTLPYIVEVDKLGQVIFQGVPSSTSADNPLIIKGALETWVRDTRSVLSDPKAEHHYIDHVYAFLDRSSPAYRTLTEWYGQRQPFEMAEKATVDVSNMNALPVGNVATSNTWTVTWDEVTTLADGSVSQPEHWTANVTFKRSPVKLEDPKASVNPIGLFITNYSWAKQS